MSADSTTTATPGSTGNPSHPHKTLYPHVVCTFRQDLKLFDDVYGYGDANSVSGGAGYAGGSGSYGMVSGYSSNSQTYAAASNQVPVAAAPQQPQNLQMRTLSLNRPAVPAEGAAIAAAPANGVATADLGYR